MVIFSAALASSPTFALVDVSSSALTGLFFEHSFETLCLVVELLAETAETSREE